MTVESLITQHIDTWTSAVKTKSTTGRGSSKKLELYGVKKLRELILELAVRGKLVPQDPNDEPASVLLERIAAEKAKLLKDGKVRKTKNPPAIEVRNIPYALPKGWEWRPLRDVTSASTGFAFKTSQYQENGTFVLRVTNINADGSINKNDNKYISPISASEEFSKYQLAKDDILLVMVGGSLGKLGRVTQDVLPAVLNQNMWKLDRFGAMPVEYLLCGLTHINSHQIQITASTHGHLAQGEYMDKLFPVSPLAEQHRIVAKVDELMALCDQLEQQTEASIEAHQLLVSTLLNTLTNSANADELMENWVRISDHFDTLFTTEESIDQLKQTILQLAVMGKLVPQDPNDEPASVLLERIAEEKTQLIKEKKIKKQKALPPIADDEKPFDLPTGWEWCRFEDVVEIYSGITKGRKLSGRELKTIPYLSVANVQRGYLNLQNVKEIDLPIDEIEKYSVLEGDLLITEGGDWDKVGRTAIWRSEVPYMAHQNHVFKARPYLSEQSEVWIEMYLNGPFARDYFAGSSKQTTNLASINKTQLRSCFIAVPPNGEKQRITSKVKDLIEMCNLLLERIARCQQTQYHLTDAIVEQAV